MTSTSITVVNWAEIFSDSTIRSAITLRNLVIVTEVPRSGETAIGVFGADEVVAYEAGAFEITWADGAEAAAGAAAKISSLRIRPPTPVPLMVARFTPASAANLRTIGVT